MAGHTERLHLPYSRQQLFDLVADVERYPEFAPWVVGAKIRRREGQSIWVDMLLGTRLFNKRFSTVARLDRPHRIDIRSGDPLLEYFEENWTFEPAAQGGTVVTYHVDFRFRSRALQALIGASLAERAAAMAGAFRHRARQLYGAPAPASS